MSKSNERNNENEHIIDSPAYAGFGKKKRNRDREKQMMNGRKSDWT